MGWGGVGGVPSVGVTLQLLCDPKAMKQLPGQVAGAEAQQEKAS